METFEQIIAAEAAPVDHADHVRIVEEEREALIEEMRQGLRLMQEALILSLTLGNPQYVLQAFEHVADHFMEHHGCYCGQCEVPASAEASEGE